MATNPSSIETRDVAGLDRLVDDAVHAGEVLLTRGGKPVARIIPVREWPAPRRGPGSARGIVHMADDFDVMPGELEPYF